MSCFMVINGSCSTNMCARQLSFNFSSMVWGAMVPCPHPLWIRPCDRFRRFDREHPCDQQTDTQTTLRATFVAVDRIYVMCVMWPK